MSCLHNAYTGHHGLSWWDTGLHCFIMRNGHFLSSMFVQNYVRSCSYNLLQQSVVFVVYILPCKSSCTSNIFTKATYEDHKPSKIRYKPWLVFLRPPPPKLHHAPLVHIQYTWQHMFIKLTGHLPRLQIMVSVSPNSCIDLQL